MLGVILHLQVKLTSFIVIRRFQNFPLLWWNLVFKLLVFIGASWFHLSVSTDCSMEKQISVFYPNNFTSNARCLSFELTEIKDNPSTQSSSCARVHVQSVGYPDHRGDEGLAVAQPNAHSSNAGWEINGNSLDYF